MVKFYICPDCGELTTSDRLLESVELGGLDSCYCNYMKLQWSVEYQDFEPVYFRAFSDWREIPEKVYKDLEKQSNTVLRLEMLRTVPRREFDVLDRKEHPLNYFWYSAGQKEVRMLQSQPVIFCQCNDGQIAEYTEWTHKPRPDGLWTDYKFVGVGEYYGTYKNIYNRSKW